MSQKIHTKHYIKLFYPGAFFSDTAIQEIESREKFEIPKNVYAYQFFDKEEFEVNGEAFTSKEKNFSPTYYFGVELELSAVINKYGKQSIVVQNMECNGWDKVIETEFGQCFPLNEKDIVLPKRIEAENG